jgi:hypothetical protein
MKKIIKLKFDDKSIEHLITERYDSYLTETCDITEQGLTDSGFFLYESPLSEKTILAVDSNFKCKLAFCETFLEAKIIAEYLSPEEYAIFRKEYAIFGSEMWIDDKCEHDYVVWYPVTE